MIFFREWLLVLKAGLDTFSFLREKQNVQFYNCNKVKKNTTSKNKQQILYSFSNLFRSFKARQIDILFCLKAINSRKKRKYLQIIKSE